MAMVYETLGAGARADKVRWSVLSFRQAQPDDPDLAAACATSEPPPRSGAAPTATR